MLLKEVEYAISLSSKFNYHTQDVKADTFEVIKNIEDTIAALGTDKTQENCTRETIIINVKFVQNSRQTEQKCVLDRYFTGIFKQIRFSNKRNEDLVVTRANKGQVTVIINQSEYLKIALAMLNDKETYQVKDSNLAIAIEKYNTFNR